MDLWYAPYAEYALKNNLMNFSGNQFLAEKFLTRAETASAIWTMMGMMGRV